jgi:hypothetical protein
LSRSRHRVAFEQRRNHPELVPFEGFAEMIPSLYVILFTSMLLRKPGLQIVCDAKAGQKRFRK